MAGYRHLITILLIVIVIYISVSATELHRTKTALHRSSGKIRRGANTGSEDVANDFDVNSENMFFGHASYETLTCALFSSVLVGLSGIFPLLVIPLEAGPSLKHGAAATRLKLLLSFAVGALLGDVFLHLLPEAWAHLDKDSEPEAYSHIGLWVITGILVFLIIEKIFGEKENLEESEGKIEQLKTNSESVKNNGLTVDGVHHRKNKHDKNHLVVANGKQNHKQEDSKNIKITGYLNLFANVIDNFTHGLAVGGSYLVSRKVGMVTTVAILLHEIPHEIGDFAILLKSGFNRWKAAKAQLLTATGGVIGAITALSAESPEAAGNRTAWILPFTSGGFLYIALVTVVPELLQERCARESIKQVLCLVSGVFSMALVTLIFEG